MREGSVGDKAPPAHAVDFSDLGSGYLTDAGREAAVAAALPLVATYFRRSSPFGLRAVRRIGAGARSTPDRIETDVDPVLAALRLRVALVAGDRLIAVLRNVVSSANFRYEQIRDEHVGHLRGRLDTVRYLRERGRRTVPRRYPVRNLRRSSVTPENVLAAAALRWLIRELDTSVAIVAPPATGAETQKAAAVRADLIRLGSHVVLRDANHTAEQVRRRERLPALLDNVEARIRAGHVSRPDKYRKLTAWIRQSVLAQPLAQSGDIEAAFYGPDFDDKLFELWCLTKTAEALTVALGEPNTRNANLLVRRPAPLFAWDAGADRVELYFQPSLANLSGKTGRWCYHPTGEAFRGFPDIGARCRHVDGSTDIVLIDAKLRRRNRRAPAEEIYKMLGYLNNVEGLKIRLGGIVFHDPRGFYQPTGPRQYTLIEQSDGTRGQVEAVAVDPTDLTGTSAAFALLAALVLQATGIDSEQARAVAIRKTQPAHQDSDANEEERHSDRAQQLAVMQLQALAGRVPAAVLDATAGHLRTVLDGAWSSLGSAVKRMVVTAVHFGDTAPEGADLAGPVLGLCAPVERLLRDRLAQPALAEIRNQSGCDPDRWTLGTLLARLSQALDDGPRGPAAAELRQYLDSTGAALSPIEALLPALDTLRSRHRNRAAHQGLLDRPQWVEVYRTVVLADHALLPMLAAALPPWPEQAEAAGPQ